MSTKGFTLVELLLVLFITSLSLLLAPNIKEINPRIDVELFESEVINHQFMAILTHKETEVNSHTLSPYPIRFSALGNVHFAQTIDFYNTKLTMSLGPGRIYEKSEYLD